MSRQCLSTRRDRAIFSPSVVHTGWRRGNLGQIGLAGRDATARGGGPNVDHENFTARQLLHLGLLAAVRRLHAQQAAEQIVTDFNFRKDGRQLSLQAQHLSHQPIGAGQGRVDAGADANQAAGHGELQVVLLGVQTADATVNGGADNLAAATATLLAVALRIGGRRRGGRRIGQLVDNPGAHFNFIAHPQDALQNGSPRHAALEGRHILSGPIDIKGANDNEPGPGGKVPDRQRNFAHQIFADAVHIVFEDRRDGENGGGVGDGAGDEFSNLLLLGRGGVGLDEIDLVLENENVLEAHDFHRGQVFAGLGLGAGFVAGDEENGGVHDGGAVQHGGHENVVARAVDEGDVAAEFVAATAFDEFVGMGTAAASEEWTSGSGGGVNARALIYFGIGVTQFDGNVSFEFGFEADRLHARKRFDNG
jgi:hypothetical protein